MCFILFYSNVHFAITKLIRFGHLSLLANEMWIEWRRKKFYCLRSLVINTVRYYLFIFKNYFDGYFCFLAVCWCSSNSFYRFVIPIFQKFLRFCSLYSWKEFLQCHFLSILWLCLCLNLKHHIVYVKANEIVFLGWPFSMLFKFSCCFLLERNKKKWEWHVTRWQKNEHKKYWKYDKRKTLGFLMISFFPLSFSVSSDCKWMQ